MSTTDGAQADPDEDVATLSPAAARARFAGGRATATSGWCQGYAQANVIALPRELAFDMMVFAQRNPKPCPVLEVIDAGQVRADPGGAVFSAPGSDIRTDLPRYRVYRRGTLAEEVDDARPVWREDLVTFVIGCSFTFEHPLLAAGIPLRHLDAGRNVPMYRTALRCRSAGRLAGPLVVSMRGIPADRVADAVRISSRYPAVHGAPVHVGDPAALGIESWDEPDYGDAPALQPGDVPVFWACGVTPQAMVLESCPEVAITHSPGHMLVTDARDADYLVP
ncbi:MAG TPA: putative hydro-lyase [Ornithinimicrobium sp.]|uniref:putative hydro-lyase n=1 Tax=Ornithinimicrobium sp. TaxID=1977084 RepID=UPI002B45EE15|nr:putative hydro-lyase [Ornithinimicrobium sp.]HKJ11411.1 putative hydro-lyase [Ornithinimicrobium sp.]